MISAHSHRTWTLSDGHAGNLRQAEALARALGLPVEHDITLQAGMLARLLAPRTWPGASRAFGAGFANALASPPELAIGCGRQAALATRLLRVRGARAVQILDPRIDPRHWDVVIAPEHDGLRGQNVVTLLGSLHPVDDPWLADARAAFPAFDTLPRPRTALLLGGPSAHARFAHDEIAAFLHWLRERVRSDGGSLLATTSRRTPPEVAALLRETARELPGFAWTGDADGANPYAGVLAFADRIVCSADSVNMLSEAAATTAPLYAAGVERVEGRPRRFVDALIARGRALACGESFADAPAVPLRETAQVAEEVSRRLGIQGSAEEAFERRPGERRNDELTNAALRKL